MVEFDLWRETFIFGSIFAMIVLIPCVLVTLIGKKMIDRCEVKEERSCHW